MTDMIKEVTDELKATMLEMMLVFKQELDEKNQQITNLEHLLKTQQQLTIQANNRINKLEKGKKRVCSPQ